jgi:hypothetical protein
MCFSAQASFIASGGLVMIGILTMRIVKDRSLLPIAIVPFMFGLQQFSEGLIWLGQGIDGAEDLLWYRLATWIFLMFAYCTWPVWIPLSMWAAEKNEQKTKYLGVLTLFGGCIAGFNLYWGLSHDTQVKVVNHSIQYITPSSDELNLAIKYLYTIPALLPFFISSVRGIWGMGAGVAIGFVVANWIYYETFASVWCFYAAVVSLYLYQVIRWEQNNAIYRK